VAKQTILQICTVWNAGEKNLIDFWTIINESNNIRSLISLAFCLPIVLVLISFIEKVDKYGFDWPRHNDKKKSTE